MNCLKDDGPSATAGQLLSNSAFASAIVRYSYADDLFIQRRGAKDRNNGRLTPQATG